MTITMMNYWKCKYVYNAQKEVDNNLLNALLQHVLNALLQHVVNAILKIETIRKMLCFVKIYWV